MCLTPAECLEDVEAFGSENADNRDEIVRRVAKNLFMISNAPSYQKVRGRIWIHDGKSARSLSVCDVVIVEFADGEKFGAICFDIGWHVDRLEELEPVINQFRDSPGYADRIAILMRLAATRF